jgi:hypothetical protein
MRTVEHRASVTAGAAVEPNPELVLSCHLFKECPRPADWLAIVNCPNPSLKPTCEHHREWLFILLHAVNIDPETTVRFVEI